MRPTFARLNKGPIICGPVRGPNNVRRKLAQSSHSASVSHPSSLHNRHFEEPAHTMCEKGICSRPQKALTQVFISMQPSMLPMIMQGSYNCSVHNPNFLRSLHTQCASKAYGFTMEGLRASVHCALCTCVAQHVVNDCARAHIVLVHSTPLCKQPTQKKNIAYMHGARVACGSMPLQDPHWVNSQCFYAKPASTHKVLYVGSVYSKLVWGLSEGQFALARQGPGVRYLV